ncbi:MAG TPA: tRNA epoxyqueuosine(34) reductase QueG [Candidatus Angelobacter sp.]|nr:tRNA epoxyqueuosine(34) reductase QueG [Candidatus Angelobacter sp.]
MTLLRNKLQAECCLMTVDVLLWRQRLNPANSNWDNKMPGNARRLESRPANPLPSAIGDNEHMVTAVEIAQAARQAALQAGFDLAGIAPVREEDLPELDTFVQWVDDGCAGEMKYLETRTEAGDLRRSSARNAAPWVKSMIVCAMNYSADKPYSVKANDPERGWISRYAWGSKDYHHALLPRLRQVETEIKRFADQRGMSVETRSYVDTGPIMERVYAKYAGIGWIGKNTCIIHQQMGSWLFLGVVLTSLELPPDAPAADRCGSCTRCIDACPTDAIVAPGKLDARLCIAYLTIEKRGAIPEELRPAIGHHIFGCDICQDVCPWNNKAGNAPPTSLPEFQPQEKLYHPELRWLAQMGEETYRQVFRGSPVKRTKYSGLKRNVAVAMGNSGNKDFVPDLEEIAEGPDPVAAEHAQWALRKLREE